MNSFNGVRGDHAADDDNDDDEIAPPSAFGDINNHSETPPRNMTPWSTTTPSSSDDLLGTKRRTKPPNPGTPQTPPAKRSESRSIPPADIVVFVTQTDLYDAEFGSDTEEANGTTVVGAEPHWNNNNNTLPAAAAVAAYHYDSNNGAVTEPSIITICRVPPSPLLVTNPFWMDLQVFDRSVPNPFDRSVRKYWNQRRRLFSRFDAGVQLDEEGWFSVTPEQIADHVAAKTMDVYRHEPLILSSSSSSSLTPNDDDGLVVLDAFCGCGGNAIAYARRPEVRLVVCVDVDRAKLLRAANNAAIYEIPATKMIFIECNVLFLLEHCYKNGEFILDQPIDTAERAEAMMAAMPPPVPSERTNHGYQVGGIDMLPSRIGAVFMDPPWGGVDYKVFGKDGYCLEQHMRIPRPSNQLCAVPQASEGVSDGFFDSFCATEPRNKQERKAVFNIGLGTDNSVNGAELLRLAASAAANAVVVYDVPRNTNRTSLGRAAMHAGYRGNCKLVEHCLNGRLKTITAYFGIDWRDEVLQTNASL